MGLAGFSCWILAGFLLDSLAGFSCWILLLDSSCLNAVATQGLNNLISLLLKLFCFLAGFSIFLLDSQVSCWILGFLAGFSVFLLDSRSFLLDSHSFLLNSRFSCWILLVSCWILAFLAGFLLDSRFSCWILAGFSGVCCILTSLSSL
jgi:hypothetical protein